MSEWKEFRLSDLMRIKYGKDHKHLLDGIIPLYGSGGIMRFVEKPLYEDESILIPRKGTLSNLFYLDRPFWSVDTMFYSVINKTLVFPKYLFYHLKTLDLASLNVGSAVPSLTTEVLNDVKVCIPDLPTQTAIAEILSSLDDKIELNNKINQELEDLAQTLFKRWFIDFEFPNENGDPYKSSGGEMVDSELGEIPKGWGVKRLKEISSIKRGGSPRPIHDYLTSSGLPWVKISDATSVNHPFLFSTKEFIKESGLKKTVFLKKGSLILSNSATPGLPKFLEIDACIHDGWLYFQDLEYVSYNFLYLLFLYIRLDLVGQGNGSIFINLKTDILKEFPISIPNPGHLRLFEDTIQPILDAIKKNAAEKIELTTLRDTLLPKLISGELEVSQMQNLP
jgi:type I restriction enzyme S subunit